MPEDGLTQAHRIVLPLVDGQRDRTVTCLGHLDLMLAASLAGPTVLLKQAPGADVVQGTRQLIHDLTPIRLGVAPTMPDGSDSSGCPAAEFLGTKTKEDNVNRALSEYVQFRLRMSLGERLISGGLPDLADPEIMGLAWR